jgi:hypothetical protein
VFLEGCEDFLDGIHIGVELAALAFQFFDALFVLVELVPDFIVLAASGQQEEEGEEEGV